MLDEKKTCQKIHLLLFLGTLLAGFSLNNLVPGISSITQTLNTDPDSIQLTFPAFLISFAFAQLFYGTISDYYGRRYAYILGLLIFIIGAIICYLSISIPVFLLGRFIQGAGIGCTIVLSIAILLDLQKHPLTSNFTYIIITVTIGIVAAPICSVYISFLWHWQLIYLVASIYGLILLFFAIFYLPETNFYCYDEHVFFLQNYWKLAKNRCFIGYLIISCLLFSMPLVIFSTLPLLLATVFHLPPFSFTWLTLFCVGFFMMGCYLGYLLTKHLSTNNIINFSILVMIAASAGGLFLSTLEFIHLSVVYIPICFLLMGAGIILPRALSACLEKVKQYPGTAISVQVFFLGIIAGLSHIFTAILSEENQLPLMGLLLILSIATLLIFWLLIPKNKVIRQQ